MPAGRRLIVRLFGPPAVSRILILGTGQVADRLTSRLGRCRDTVVVGYVTNLMATRLGAAGRVIAYEPQP